MSRFDAARFGRLALVYGGESAEREISLRSGRAVSAALERLGVDHAVFDGPRAVVDAARDDRIDTVFNMLHGRGGEDGCLQGALASLLQHVQGHLAYFRLACLYVRGQQVLGLLQFAGANVP